MCIQRQRGFCEPRIHISPNHPLIIKDRGNHSEVNKTQEDYFLADRHCMKY